MNKEKFFKWLNNRVFKPKKRVTWGGWADAPNYYTESKWYAARVRDVRTKVKVVVDTAGTQMVIVGDDFKFSNFGL
jgi:hypothetical protein